MNAIPSLHIVRRYGPVGGMERYVWELTHALAAQGHPVEVLCEKAYQSPDKGIKVHTLGEIPAKPRWFSMLRFSHNVSRWIKQSNRKNRIIHSHERTSVHDVTTFHGPPFLERKKRPLDLFSPRIHTWQYLEKRELCGPQVRKILPNSDLIRALLLQHYPAARQKMAEPAYPAVADHFFALQRRPGKQRIGLIGKEWQRKGLEFACSLIRQLQPNYPEMVLIVAGPEPQEIAHLFADWPEGSYALRGWARTEEILGEIDILLHPAQAEPFGMVIAEANAAGIPVLLSDQCGIAPLISHQMGRVLPLNDERSWLSALEHYLDTDQAVEKLELTWCALAKQHSALYSEIILHKDRITR